MKTIYKLLFVDDEMPNLRLLDRVFREHFHCLSASSGAEAILLLEQHDVAIIITDQRMPGLTGIELLKQTAALRPHMVRILLTGYTDVEALTEAINCGLVDTYITKPWNNDDLKRRVHRAVEQYDHNKKADAMQVANERLSRRLKEMKVGFAQSLGEVLRAKDEHACEHACRVSTYVTEMGEKLELAEHDREELALAALLHNIGCIGTPGQLEQGTELTKGEEISNPELGARILGPIPELRNVADIVRFHRENFDGSGYPRRLAGEQIPIASRILRVADEYDLLTHPRLAATAMTHKEAIEALESRAGLYDPQVVEIVSMLAPLAHIGPSSSQWAEFAEQDIDTASLEAQPLIQAVVSQDLGQV